MAKVIDKANVVDFLKDIKTGFKSSSPTTHEQKLKIARSIFFGHFRLSDLVPAELRDDFIKIASFLYDAESLGYHGIIEEIKDRTELYYLISDTVEVREYFKHGAGKTDFYDKENRISYEKKTGCGDWLRSERSTTFEEVIEEYKRKRTLIRWDYEYTARPEGMTGTKTVKNGEEVQERTKAKASKEYDICIHIETTYKALFDYMATYPKGIKTFFKESKRSGVAGVYVWELQTLKNSKSKIAFLQAFGKEAIEEEED